MDDTRRARCLFVTYDGLTDPLGRSQILPYLTGLAAKGHRITILSCEKPERFERDVGLVATLCSAAGLEWTPLRYHKSPAVLSSLYDCRAMLRKAARLHAEQDYDLVHCRSYLPALVGLSLQRRFGLPWIFDMRGFWIEERVEAGSWRLSNPVFRAVHRYFKARERAFLACASAIVSLTESAARELIARDPGLAARITIIPCCVDLDLFEQATPERRALSREAHGISADATVLAYLGSLGGNYMLDEMLDLFVELRRIKPEARFLLVTMSDRAQIDKAVAARLLPSDSVVITASDRQKVPFHLAAADFGVAFKRASFSAKACSPTKLGEMLATGVPVIANAGVGDVEAVLAAPGAGAAISAFDATAYRAALAGLSDDSFERSLTRRVAERHFGLDQALGRYDVLYRRLRKGAAVTVGERGG